MSPQTVVNLRVRVTHVPAGSDVEFGLQDTSGRLIGGVRTPDGSIAFDAEVRVGRSADSDHPNLLRPFTHGTPTARHLYLSQRSRAGAGWTKRIKVPLAPITWAMIDMAAGRPIETDVDGRSAATVATNWTIQGQ